MMKQAWLLACLVGCGSPEATAPDASAPDAAPDVDSRGGGCIAQLSAGGHHSCALRRDGEVWCWGSNHTAELNDKTEVDAMVPRKILDGMVELASGFQHLCAIDRAGALWCWGRNAYGQIGTGSNTHSETATRIAIDQVIDVGRGVAAEHACARDVAGATWCWGRNTYGQLGLGTTELGYTPARSLATGGVPALGGNFACSIGADSQVACWGRNEFSAMGITTPGGSSPMPAVAGATFEQLSAGAQTTCGLKADRSAWCWGDGSQGQLGEGVPESHAPVHLLDEVEQIVSSGNFVCARKLDRTLWCWGKNLYGQLGTGTTDYPPAPAPTLVTDAVDVALGISHACALTGDGTISCWGYNGYGQLGRGGEPSTDPYPVPVAVTVPCGDGGG